MREVVVADAFEWLDRQDEGPLLAYLPEATGYEPGDLEYLGWIERATASCLWAAGGAPSGLFVVDRLADGRWFSKTRPLLRVAEDYGARLVAHRIYYTREPGVVDLRRPSYAHGLFFGPRPGKRRPDVLPFGRRLWPRGIGVGAARDAVSWIAELAPGATVLNPFCGRGTFLAAASEVGLDGRGCDVDAESVAAARSLVLPDPVLPLEGL